ncbi:MAG: hypothetical protein HFH39_04045 [Lachnospiraceae bacterium]|nr:hypothetical protein [Lachnospiraceae bacterium]
MTITIETSEFVETKDGGYFEHHTREEEFPDSEKRHKDLCVVCGFPSYPECRRFCASEGDTLKRTVIDEEKIKGKLTLTPEEFEDAVIRTY